MKYVLSALAIICILSIGYTQCSTFYDIKEGTMMEQTSYDAKGKKTGKQVITFKDFESTSSSYSALMSIQSFDKNDDKIGDTEMGMSCDQGTIQMDMSKFLNQEQMKSFESMDIKIDAENLEMPQNLTAGQSLPGAKVTVTISGPMNINMQTQITNRKVVGKESITTPVGPFDCFKITYDISIKAVMKMEMRGEEYWSEKVGVVKSVSYKSNGKKVGETVLTAYTR
jgi:preprotein translocase subunit SecF